MNLLIVSIVHICSVLFCSDIQSIRNDFHEIDSEEKLNQFISNYADSSCSEAQPYLAAAIMRQAEYCLWPGSKLSYFSEGKDQLESFINSHENNIEGRYVRALVQSQLPAFLGYGSDLDSDCEFIETNLSSSGLSPDYQETILKEISTILNAR